MPRRRPPSPADLAPVLAALPPTLAYLRPAVESLAAQPEDDLLSGEADLDPLIAVLRMRFRDLRGEAGQDRFHEDRRALGAWLDAHADGNAPALAPFHTLHGALMAVRFRDIFRSPPPPPESAAQERIDITPPRGWRLARDRTGPELSIRGVLGGVSAISGELFTQLRALPRPAEDAYRRFTPEPGYINAENDAVRGARLLTHTPPSAVSAGRLVAVFYALSVPGGHITATFAATGKADLATHLPAIESCLATARLSSPPAPPPATP